MRSLEDTIVKALGPDLREGDYGRQGEGSGT